MKKIYRAIGGDVFAGLFSQGVKEAGFELTAHLEHSNYGEATTRLNHPGVKVYTHPSLWPKPGEVGKIDFMYCNPPCAAWSSARGMSTKSSWKDHKDRLQYIEDLTDYGLHLQPKAWSWESVTNAWRHGREFVDHIAGRWLDAGYNVTIIKQNNMYLGVPQNRPRVLITSHKHPLVFPLLQPIISVREALRHVKVTAAEKREAALKSAGWQELWEAAGDLKGGNLRRIFDTYDDRRQAKVQSRPSFMAARINGDRPCPVMLAREKRLHYKEPRLLTWQEGLALCGLPPTWQTSGGLNAGFYELSRAVMPAVGRWLATAIKDGLSQRPLRDVAYKLYECDAGPEYIQTVPLENNAARVKLKPWKPEAAPLKVVRAASMPRTSNGVPRKTGSGLRIRELLQAGKDADTILAIIHKEFPGSKATKSDVSWNRGKLRAEGVNV